MGCLERMKEGMGHVRRWGWRLGDTRPRGGGWSGRNPEGETEWMKLRTRPRKRWRMPEVDLGRDGGRPMERWRMLEVDLGRVGGC